jgi:hypothetical protein
MHEPLFEWMAQRARMSGKFVEGTMSTTPHMKSGMGEQACRWI